MAALDEARAKEAFVFSGALMESAKDEIGEYSIATRFGKGKKIYHDKKWKRPVERKEFLHQIEVTRLLNRWDWSEFGRFCNTVGLQTKPLADYTDNDLKIIHGDFEKARMILLED